MEKAKKIILATRNTLNSLTVQGVENMRMILGCYDALGTALSELESVETAGEEAINE